MNMEISRVEARWKGTIDLDQEAVAALTLDGLAFFVVGVRVEQMGAIRVVKDGQAVRKDILNVTDARVMLGNDREQAVTYLARERVSGNEELKEELVMDTNDRYDHDSSNSNEQEQQEQEGIIGSIYDYKNNKPAPEVGSGGGAKVAKFVADEDLDADPVPPFKGGRVYKDKALARFLEGQ